MSVRFDELADAELDAAYAELADEVRVHEQTWWTRLDGPQGAYLDEHPEVRPRLMSRLLAGLPTKTVDIYTDPDTDGWAGSRIDTQLDILGRLDDADDEQVAARGAVDDAGDVYFVLGLPGSGKSSSLRSIAARHADLNAVPASDADDVRVEFVEYADGLGSGVVQFETALVTYGEQHLEDEGRQDRVLGRRGHAIVDVIGDVRYLPETIEQVVAEGRRAYVLVSELPVEECKRRAKVRALATGRFVAMEVIDNAAGRPREALGAALATGNVAGWAVINTSDTPVVLDGDGTFDTFV